LSLLFELAVVLVRLDHVICCIRGDGKRFVVQADELLTAFVELEAATRACGDASQSRNAQHFPIDA
jgi:hypothetical protein